MGPQAVTFVERLSLFRSVHYRRFHCIIITIIMTIILTSNNHTMSCKNWLPLYCSKQLLLLLLPSIIMIITIIIIIIITIILLCLLPAIFVQCRVTFIT